MRDRALLPEAARAWLLVGALAVAASACTLDPTQKTGCMTDYDCRSGRVCERRVCVQRAVDSGMPSGDAGAGGAGTAGGGRGGDAGGGSGAGSGGTASGGSVGGAGSTGGRTAGGGAGAGGTGGGGGMAGAGGGFGGAGGSPGAGGGDASAGAGGTAGIAGDAGVDGGPGAGGDGFGGGGTGGGGIGGGAGIGGAAGIGGSAGIGGTAGIGGGAGTAGTKVIGMCDAPVATCPAPAAGSCAETFCGGRLWRDGRNGMSAFIPYRIFDPNNRFTDAYKSAIRATAGLWSDATLGLISFSECSPCTGRFVSVVPGDGDGFVDSGVLEQILPMPVDGASLPDLPLHRIAHQWGHAIGLGHTYERADRDRYVQFDPAVWCAPQSVGPPPRCAYGPDEVGSPRIPSDTFGVYDEKSKMNGFRADGICGSDQPDPRSGEPTVGDAAAVLELFNSHVSGWAPFQPVGRPPTSSTEPFDYQLVPGVDPVGMPAAATWSAPGLDIFVRGSDGGVYGIQKQVSASAFQGWSDWQLHGIGLNGDPAAVFADADRLYLAVRMDNSIRLRARTKGTWGPWTSVGAPMGGAASPPAIAARGNWLDILVLANDGLVYHLICRDPAALCAASAAAPNAWIPLPPVPYRTIVGKPSVAYWPLNAALAVATVTAGGEIWLIGGADSFDASRWEPIASALDPADPTPAASVQALGNMPLFFARDGRGVLRESDWGQHLPPLGGVLAAPPSAVIPRVGLDRIDITALIDDRGRPGVWWKFFDGGGGYTPPCNYNAPGTCAQCGCDFAGAPSCSM